MTIEYPEAIGACIDMLYEQRAERLKLQKTIDMAKQCEADLEEHILRVFGDIGLQGAKGDIATAGIKRSTVYNIVDWAAYIAYVAKTKEWDMLQKRLSTTAVALRFDNGEHVPGVEAFQKVSLTLNKAGG